MKKRILSLILALSMVLSVLPLGAFAEGSTGGELVMKGGYPDCSNGTTGNGWSYDSSTQTLILKGKNREFDFSLANPQDTTNKTPADSAVKCAIESGAKITGGTFEGSVKNHWYITDGIFYGTVTNLREWFDGNLDTGTIQGGTFNGKVDNTVNAAIENSTFEKEVTNSAGKISGGTFKGDVTNNNRGDITGGTFNKKVTNNAGGYITGGTFAGSVENEWEISGGVFNGKTGLDGVTGLHSITWDAASSDAKIEKVNDVSANWAPYVVIESGKTKEVTITADTEIYSLNGKRLGTDYNSSYPNKNDKKTVTFTMPSGNVVLSTGELVMAGGYPIGSNNGANNYNGKGWAYSAGNLSDPTDTGTLHLWSGTFDFNFADPTTKITRTDSAVACEIQSYATIIGGIFAGSVKNGYTIENGTFTNKVENSGYINNGTFAGNVTNSGAVNGGVFNRNATLINVTGGHNITWDAASSKANIVAVNDVSANWKPYAYAGTTVTITADTDIYSLNGKSLDESSYPDTTDKKTVTFTMPDDNVVLNGAITCTELVMKDGWPQASKDGLISCSGTGWSYDHSTKTLTLTSGEYDFSSTEPVQCAIKSSATITGGTFEKKVTNNAGGTISDGIFQDTCSVTNNGTIKKGTFKDVCSVTNEGANATIENGTFKNMCRVINNSTIENGTFKNMCSVENNGTIKNGTFTYKVENNGIITGGVFNGNANLTGVTGGYNITVASNAKIEKVNGVSADWAPYVVTSNATTKTNY